MAEYPRIDHTVDGVLLRWIEGNLHVVLIQRRDEPFKGCWALPGGFVDVHETLEESLLRELKEELGCEVAGVQEIGNFDDPGRDPRGRVITTAYLVEPEDWDALKAGDDAVSYGLFPVDALPDLAFDHELIIDWGIDKWMHR